MTGAFPARVRAGEESTVDGTVTVTNVTSRRIETLSASQPDVYLTREGATVTTPLPRDDVGLVLELEPGAARDFRASGSLRQTPDQRPLSRGRYELHAVLRFGQAGSVTGGPWALEVV